MLRGQPRSDAPAKSARRTGRNRDNDAAALALDPDAAAALAAASSPRRVARGGDLRAVKQARSRSKTTSKFSSAMLEIDAFTDSDRALLGKLGGRLPVVEDLACLLELKATLITRYANEGIMSPKDVIIAMDKHAAQLGVAIQLQQAGAAAQGGGKLQVIFNVGALPSARDLPDREIVVRAAPSLTGDRLDVE